MSKSENWDFTEEEQASLSESEREALKLPEEESDEKPIEAVDAMDSDESESTDEDEQSDAEADVKVEEKSVEKVAATVEVNEEKAVEQERQSDNQITVDEQLTKINQQIDELGQKMEDGEIKFTEYNKLYSELLSQRTRIEVYQEHQNQQQIESAKHWQSVQDDFFAVPENAAIKNNPIAYQALNAALLEVSQSNEANGRDQRWILDKAAERMRESIGALLGVKPEEKAEQKPVKKREIDKVDLPVTLSSIPSAKSNAANEFDHLDRMNAVDREKAIAQLSPSELERYLECA